MAYQAYDPEEEEEVHSPAVRTVKQETKRANKYHWNQHFQAALEMPESQEKYEMINNLSTDFVRTATIYGRVIVEEQLVDAEARVVGKGKLGGTAGGDKFIVRGILFKLCKDPQVSSSPPRFVYGGTSEQLELAAKGAGHDLKSAVQALQAVLRVQAMMNDSGIKLKYTPTLPIMAIIDYMGFRVTAMPLLPLSEQVYGSADGGVTVHDRDEDFRLVVKLLAQDLHLAPHSVAGKENIYMAGDVEGHLGLDSRSYLLDLARLFPPEASKVASHLTPIGQPVFHRLLRGEFLQVWKKHAPNEPLSSDALSGWSKSSPDSTLHNERLARATTYLINTVIPGMACEMNIGVLKYGPKSDEPISVHCHRRGINIRHLGLLRSLVTDEQARTGLLVEIVSRVLKNLLRETMRDALTIGTDNPAPGSGLRDVVVGFLNRVTNTSKDSTAFWAQTVPSGITLRFGKVALTEPEATALFPIIEPFLFRVVTYSLAMAGMSLTSEGSRSLEEFNSLHPSLRNGPYRFTRADIAEAEPRVKAFDTIGFSSGKVLIHEALKEVEGSAARRLLSRGAQEFESVLRAHPLHAQARAEAILAKALAQSHFRKVDAALCSEVERAALAQGDQELSILLCGKVLALWRQRLNADNHPGYIEGLCGASSQESLEVVISAVGQLVSSQAGVGTGVAVSKAPAMLLEGLSDLLKLRLPILHRVLHRLSEGKAQGQEIKAAMDIFNTVEVITRSDRRSEKALAMIHINVDDSNKLAAVLVEGFKQSVTSDDVAGGAFIAALAKQTSGLDGFVNAVRTQYVSDAVTKAQVEWLQALGLTVSFNDGLDNGKLPLHYAVEKRLLPVVTTLLGLGVDIDLLDGKHQTAMRYAITGDSVDILKLLVLNGCRVGPDDIKFALSSTPSHISCAQLLLFAYKTAPPTALLDAVRKRDIPAIKLLLEAKADLEVTTDELQLIAGNNCTPIRMAAVRCEPNMVRLLAEAGARIDLDTYSCARRVPQNPALDVLTWYSRTPLMRAAGAGNLNEVVEILKYASLAEINRFNPLEYTSALACAATGLHEDVVQVLCEARAQVDPIRGTRPLFSALSAGPKSEKIVRLLVEKGASVHGWGTRQGSLLVQALRVEAPDVALFLLQCKANPLEIFGELDTDTPLGLACKTGATKVVEYILRHYKDYLASSAPELRESGPSDLNGNSGANLAKINLTEGLVMAAGSGKVDLVELLIQEKADVNGEVKVRSITSSRPLHAAATNNKLEATRVLLAAKADCNPPVREYGCTLLIDTVDRQADVQVVKLLLDGKADVKAVIQAGTSVLNFACSRKQEPALVTLLIQANADIASRTRDGDTPLHQAVASFQPSICSVLVEAKCDVNAKNNSGATPLLVATTLGDVEAVLKILIAAKADVNLPDNTGSTPVLVAVFKGWPNVVKPLIEAKADLSAKDSGGRTVLSIAQSHNPSSREAMLGLVSPDAVSSDGKNAPGPSGDNSSSSNSNNNNSNSNSNTKPEASSSPSTNSGSSGGGKPRCNQQIPSSMGHIGYYCNRCAMTSKTKCVRCQTHLFPGNNPNAQICMRCKGPNNNKCVGCKSVSMFNANSPAAQLCRNCSFGQVKCSALV